jgi:hypothetical protein
LEKRNSELENLVLLNENLKAENKKAEKRHKLCVGDLKATIKSIK